jgi:hypothetical protein
VKREGIGVVTERLRRGEIVRDELRESSRRDPGRRSAPTWAERLLTTGGQVSRERARGSARDEGGEGPTFVWPGPAAFWELAIVDKRVALFARCGFRA